MAGERGAQCMGPRKPGLSDLGPAGSQVLSFQVLTSGEMGQEVDVQVCLGNLRRVSEILGPARGAAKGRDPYMFR